jgi:hypothetical protein
MARKYLAILTNNSPTLNLILCQKTQSIPGRINLHKRKALHRRKQIRRKKHVKIKTQTDRSTAGPPLWGNNSYNVSAGMFRISRLASFVKYNMPYNIIQETPQLTDEEAWDVAAFINTQARPKKLFDYDWSNISAKPIDYPFGPYADNFSPLQHKLGPFEEIKKQKALTQKKLQ